jgi:hypothetical protein
MEVSMDRGEWVKSSYIGSTVQFAEVKVEKPATDLLFRDSKFGNSSTVVSVTLPTWQAFITAVTAMAGFVNS